MSLVDFSQQPANLEVQKDPSTGLAPHPQKLDYLLSRSISQVYKKTTNSMWKLGNQQISWL